MGRKGDERQGSVQANATRIINRLMVRGEGRQVTFPSSSVGNYDDEGTAENAIADVNQSKS